jgi:DNA-binding NtrC family response regulator
LVVDDEVDTCRNLADIFTDLGYRVDTAYSGESALEMVRRSRYDVALLDLMMPGMDGLALYHEIKRLRPEIVAVLATAYPTHPRAEASLQAGVWRIVPKPVDPARLLALLDEALHQPLVLVVDDDPDLCTNLWDLFRDRALRVGVAHDARSAAERLGQSAYQVILIDMRLPDGDGTTVFHAVRQTNAEAHTILITGHGAELATHLEQLTAEGADAVCYKPFDIDKLLETVERLSRSAGRDPGPQGAKR